MTKEELQKVREALEAAEALMIDMGVQSSDAYQEVEHALPLIDTALAQTEWEPVAELIRGEGGAFRVTPNMDALKAIYALPIGTHRLFAAPVAQPEQEPVAWWLTNGEVTTSKSIADVHDYRNHDKAVPLYRAPVAQPDVVEALKKLLTHNEELARIHGYSIKEIQDSKLFNEARAALAAIGEK